MTVYLVGAGPGDPDLITVRGAEVLGRADVVVYDRLSAAALLALAPSSAECISVGKTPGHESTAQADINALLVERGKAGLEVVRLKGGDPFVFARGGEEAAALRDAGVRFEVVPGITSAIAVPAYAGIPLTHRGMATSFTVVTGHEAPWAATETDWEAVARVGGTIVVLMGVATRAQIAERLIAGGLAADTPVASVQWGTRSDQRTVRSTLSELGVADIEAPATIVIGAVAALDVGWFEQRPLFGKRIVVTRSTDSVIHLARALRDVGAETVELPTIDIQSPEDGGDALRAAVADVATFDWVVFTSRNAVWRFVPRLSDSRALGGVRLAAIGRGTSAALSKFGLRADVVPNSYVAEALVEAMPPGPGRVLFPRAAAARDVVADGLRAKGWTVEEVVAYRTVTPRVTDEALSAARTADVITFASSSAVRGYLEVAGRDAVPPAVVCIGPITAQTARDNGLHVDAQAARYSLSGLVEAVVGLFRT